METRKAIISFSQSEKIKSGLIWASQSLELLNSLPEKDKQAGEKIIKVIISMIADEVNLARRQSDSEEDASVWGEVGKHIQMAVVMINSHVAYEAVFHLTQALPRVTGIGHRSMSSLIEKGLF